MDTSHRLSAAQAVQQIQAALPAEIQADSVDVFLEGDPDLKVNGIAVTMMATIEVLEEAAAAGANLVITHEPLYFNHHNAFASQFATALDPVLLAKRGFLAENQTAVWHCHDQLHQVKPDMIHFGTLTALGWPVKGIGALGGASLADIPQTSLGEVLRHVADKLGCASLRYVGDLGQPVRRVALSCGYAGLEPLRPALCADGVDLALVGEAWEWEFGEYAFDSAWLAARGGQPRAFAVLGHIPSEQQGMAFFAERLGEILPEVPIGFFPATDIYCSF